ncbi:N-acetylmuramoyl-L-alanine amidase-like domain-containing protein [Aquimarina pacifica]|uniref:N-acetylmuramoyl-L-alanine amidase-like domain-containing protein n=1 Tax=Aquimarina pacifica TaxID=1296415 RepID=UPI00046F418A|nr:N-acetylmuramoyl-L-alanine amidase-like domain-containing protein [Aquimarina pacifica]
MAPKNILLFFFVITNILSAQHITCSVKDKELFSKKIEALKNNYIPTSNFGVTVVNVGKTFLGTPYVAKTLEVGTKESLVINLQGLDCTTFVENVVAFSLMLKNNRDDFDSYVSYLEKIRYKNGKLDGYASRLHYFSEWISDNENKKIIKDITGEIGGIEINKKIDFMSTHRDLYPFLSNQQNFERIQKSETQISTSELCFLPRNQIKENEELIKSGDIIALTTSIKGLDVTHTGIAFRDKSDGRIHLLHASSKGHVEISKLPLVEYLQKIKNNTGILICRPQ